MSLTFIRRRCRPAFFVAMLTAAILLSVVVMLPLVVGRFIWEGGNGN